MSRNQPKRKVFYSNIFTAEMICYYQTHIIEFVYEVIFQNKPEYSLSEQQKDLLLVIQNNSRVSAKSGKGIGKTSSISFAIIWFLCCFDSPKIICTAPSYPTIKSALWPEISKWINISLVKDIFTQTEEKLYLNENPMNWFCEPRTAKEKENLQGLHQQNMLIIIDEASGLKQEIFEALDTTLTSTDSKFENANNKLVMIGNPTQVSGPFFESFNMFSKRWITKTYSALNSPHVNLNQIEYYTEKYGEHHDLYLVNILGEFPSGSPDAFIKLSDIHAAVQRSSEYYAPVGEIEIGLDVARFGDDSTVLYWRQGYKVYPAKVMAKNTIPEAVEMTLKTVEEIRKRTRYDKTIRIKVDDSGVGGGCTDLLKLDREHNIEVISCNFGGKGDIKYHNEASIMWGKVKELINIIALPDDKHLIEELSSRRWRQSPSGKIMIEPKGEYKKDFKSSPDRADALALCFANKSNEKTIIKNFDCLDKNIIKKELVYTGNNKLCSVFYSKDLMVSISYCSFDGNKLYILDEYVGEDSIVYVSININQHQPLTKIIGNDKMFGNVKEDLSTKFRKYNIKISENYNFNEISATDSLINMFNMKKIVINEKCYKTIEQLRDWKIDTSKLDQERKFGLCYALCNVVSDLRKQIQTPRIINTFKPYSNQNIINKSNKDSWMI
jgi:phage terminase large subunit